MPRINEIEIRVKELLETYPQTRNNDNLLYVKYIEEYYYTEFNRETFVKYEEKGLPSYKSIERCRRKIKNEQNVCRATEETEQRRQEAEKYYKNNF